MSKYFKRKEFECQCGKCGFDIVDFELMQVMDNLREVFGIPIVITSGNRCEEHNKNEGGAPKSMHLTGKACDFRPTLNQKDFDNKLEELHDYLLTNFPDRFGIARGSNFIHLDVRPNKSRWTY